MTSKTVHDSNLFTFSFYLASFKDKLIYAVYGAVVSAL